MPGRNNNRNTPNFFYDQEYDDETRSSDLTEEGEEYEEYEDEENEEDDDTLDINGDSEEDNADSLWAFQRTLVRQNAFFYHQNPFETWFPDRVETLINLRQKAQLIELFKEHKDKLDPQVVKFYYEKALDFLNINKFDKESKELFELMDPYVNPIPDKPDPQINQVKVEDAIHREIIDGEKIADILFCSLSGVFITEAVIIKTQQTVEPQEFKKGDLCFEKSQLEYWVQNKKINPYTNTPISMDDIIPCDKVQRKIDKFIDKLDIMVDNFEQDYEEGNEEPQNSEESLYREERKQKHKSRRTP